MIASLLGTQLETLKSSLTFLFTHLTSKLNGQVLRVSLHHASHSYPVDMCALYLSITGWHSLLKGPCSCRSPSLCLQTTWLSSSHQCLLPSYPLFKVSVQCHLLHESLHVSPWLDVILSPFEPCYQWTSPVALVLLCSCNYLCTFLFLLEPCSLKCGPCTSSISSIWELIRNAESWFSPGFGTKKKKKQNLRCHPRPTESEFVFFNSIPQVICRQM